MILRVAPGNRQELARFCVSGFNPLANRPGGVSVECADGVHARSLSVKHLFRTPSLVGQDRSTTALPDFFFARTRARDQRQTAENADIFVQVLCAAKELPSLKVSSDALRTKVAGCGSHGYWQQVFSAQGLRRAATPRASRRLSAARRALARPRCLTAISLQGPRLARPATSFIASRTRATVTDPAPRRTPRAPLTHTQCAGPDDAIIQAGFLRFDFPQTKDRPCSKRS